MSYVVLARKWRPQSFEDLVGQDHVSATLGNAIQQQRVAHAFLFTGVRGVGKTTSARILAKALNCQEGPTATPCQVCAQCKEIAAGNDVDVQEIDGASYNGVDEVRRLQESLPYRPSRDRFKIFIVDEVHMLSSAAWNAFLKTLEEPPPHVKFIFATTEVHKVPVTILSRCQRYDFKLLTAQTIARRLRYVLDKEGVGAEDPAIAILAREAAGSMRDAMSLLDQVIAGAAGEGQALTADGVSRVLGVAARSVLHRLGDALVDGDAAACLRIVGDLAEQGYDLPHVSRDFLAHLRDLTVAKVALDPAGLLDLSDAEVADVKTQAARTSIEDLTRLHLGFSKAFDDIVKSGQPRAALEMTLVRLARRPALVPYDELLRKLTDLERRLGGSPGTGGPDRSPPKASPAAPRQGGPPPPPAPPTKASSFAPPTPPAPPPPKASFSPPATANHSTDRVAARPTSYGTHSGNGAPNGSSPVSAPPVRPPASSTKPASTSAPAPPPAEVPPPADLEPWRAIVGLVRGKRPALASVLEHAVVLQCNPERVLVGYEQGSFLAAQATDSAANALLTSVVREHFGPSTELAFDLAVQRGMFATIAQIETAEKKARIEAARRAVTEHPLVNAAIEFLGAELRDVRLSQELTD